MKGHFVATLFCAASAVFLLVQGGERSTKPEYVEFPASIVGCEKVDLPYVTLFACAEECQLLKETCVGFQFWRDTKVCNVCLRAMVTEIKRGLASFYLTRFLYGRDLPHGGTWRMEVPQGLLKGGVFHFKAMMQTQTRFSVNFLASGGRVALTVEFRSHFGGDNDTLVLAYKVNGAWENDKRFRYPIENGQVFNVYVLVTNECFVILVDDILEAHFEHRVPVDDIEAIETTGKAKFYEISL